MRRRFADRPPTSSRQWRPRKGPTAGKPGTHTHRRRYSPNEDIYTIRRALQQAPPLAVDWHEDEPASRLGRTRSRGLCCLTGLARQIGCPAIAGNAAACSFYLRLKLLFATGMSLLKARER